MQITVFAIALTAAQGALATSGYAIYGGNSNYGLKVYNAPGQSNYDASRYSTETATDPKDIKAFNLFTKTLDEAKQGQCKARALMTTADWFAEYERHDMTQRKHRKKRSPYTIIDFRTEKEHKDMGKFACAISLPTVPTNKGMKDTWNEIMEGRNAVINAHKNQIIKSDYIIMISRENALRAPKFSAALLLWLEKNGYKHANVVMMAGGFRKVYERSKGYDQNAQTLKGMLTTV